MGWSCARAAAWVLDSFSKACLEQSGSQNNYEVKGKKYFFERSNVEHRDGAITGIVWKFLPDGEHIKRSGSFRVEGDGKVTRAPAFLKAAAKVKPEEQLRVEEEERKNEEAAKLFAEGAMFVVV